MITHIKVDGFKSLSDFNLELKQGLNILVGPNGAGKTNIVLFFEFLSYIANYQVGQAVSSVGGAGAIFQKVGKQDYRKSITATVNGFYQVEKRLFVIYEYSFTIKISFEKDNVYFTNQHVKTYITNKLSDDLSEIKDIPKWDLDIGFTSDDDLKTTLKIESYNPKKMRSRIFASKNLLAGEDLQRYRSFVTNQKPLFYCLIRGALMFSEFQHAIMTDLKGGETFNIVPSKVRELEDSATPPGIKKDGSGLATTLYAMKKNRSNRKVDIYDPYILFSEDQHQYSHLTLDKIISFLKLANSTITALEVDNDPFNNTLVTKISIKTGEYEAVLPLSSMSDGTIKWLTLITGILTSKTIFSIEEPENFLHPWMQAEIANIMRDHIDEKKTKSFVLMTTHSESLLNHAKPEEIIIVDLKEGRTIARRIKNISIYKDEIANSGFGIGYFYFNNSLAHE
ncbi:AAA family ATPase [Mucilaginibacter sp. Mucisp86]|uniref:AAA family ATPase n=1 Tax=Mucilaginibacter sp. Mucisp86 TaxID=3243060 RepID=UPI0039B3AEA6